MCSVNFRREIKHSMKKKKEEIDSMKIKLESLENKVRLIENELQLNENKLKDVRVSSLHNLYEMQRHFNHLRKYLH